MKLIQITDLHLVEPGERLFGEDPRFRLRSCLMDIAARHADADLLVMTGDLAHRGDRAAYQLLRDELAGYPIPTRLLVGNHDDRATFRLCFPDAPANSNGFVQSFIDTELGRFLFLDTNEPGTHEGCLCKHRRAWLSERLVEADGRPIYLFMHHPPGSIGYRPCDDIGLRDGDELLALLSPYRVRHIFFGHVHRPVSGSWRQIPFSALRGLNHQVWLDFAVNDGIPCSLEPPAYAVILVDENGVVVHLHDFLDSSPKYLYRPELPPQFQIVPLGLTGRRCGTMP